jgi:glycosyltransferase involved in cell wall biosynthesis
LLANSSLTYTHVSDILSTSRITLLYPPVEAKRIATLSKGSQKEDLIIAIGRFEPERKYEDLIYVLKKVKTKCKTLIIGYSYDNNYVKRLKRMIKNIDTTKNKVELLLNADRKHVLSNLVKAKIIVHTAIREPFGIAIVEGMASGCIPVVRQGFNGPWIDITQSGRYGIGFKSSDELALIIEDVLHNYEDYKVTYNIVDRALYFDVYNFQTRFLHTMLKLIRTQV